MLDRAFPYPMLFFLQFRRWLSGLANTIRGIPPISESVTTLWEHAPRDVNKTWDKLNYLVLDLEFTSLNPQQGDIISLGWVKIIDGAVELNTCKYTLVKCLTTFNDSASIHGLRHCDLNDGIEISSAIDQLLLDLQGCILVFHHSPLDLAYLNKYLIKFHNSRLIYPYIDTLALEKKKWYLRQDHIPKGALSLNNCRAQYNLSKHTAHHALEDAIATAELLLAHIQHKRDIVLARDLLSRY